MKSNEQLAQLIRSVVVLSITLALTALAAIILPCAGGLIAAWFISLYIYRDEESYRHLIWIYLLGALLVNLLPIALIFLAFGWFDWHLTMFCEIGTLAVVLLTIFVDWVESQPIRSDLDRNHTYL